MLEAKPRADDAAAIDSITRDALKSWRVPGAAIAVIRDGEVIYLKGHGVRDVGGKELVTPDTIFPIASCTKGFTTAALAALVDDGKLGWDDPVRKHLSYFRLSDPLASREVTLRDLACHRTGLGPHELLWYRSPWTAEEVVRRAGLLPLDKPFRSAFQYQTTMFTAAGLAVESASGMTWDSFVKKRLLDPLGMSATVFTTTAAEGSSERALPHRYGADGQPVTMPFYSMKAPEPAGSIQSTARDLAKWLHFQLGGNPSVLSRRRLLEMHTPHMVISGAGTERELLPETRQASYGLGWVIHDYRGYKIIAHAGAIDGFRAQLTMVPEKKLGIVVLANLHHTRLNLALSNSLIDHLLDLPTKDWNGMLQAVLRKGEEKSEAELRDRLARRHRDTRPSRELGAYVGTYEHPAYGSVRITLESGRLVWNWNSFAVPLEHFHYDTFTLTDDLLDGTFAVFHLNEAGNVASMKVEGRLGVKFTRHTGKR